MNSIQSLLLMCLVVMPPGSGAPIENGGFESGLTGWRPLWTRDPNAGALVLDSASAHVGKNAARIQHRGEKDWSFEPARRIPVKMGDRFELAAWLKVISDSDGDRFAAVQAAAVEWLKEVNGPHQEMANVVWHERFEYGKPTSNVTEAPDIGDWLECRTFFTELRKRQRLRQRIWPETAARAPTDIAAFSFPITMSAWTSPQVRCNSDSTSPLIQPNSSPATKWAKTPSASYPNA